MIQSIQFYFQFRASSSYTEVQKVEPIREIQNSTESAKNCPCDKSSNNCDDSKPTDWNPTGDPDYNPYSEEENDRWDSEEHESDY